LPDAHTHQEGWIFDIELILLALWLSIPVQEVAVHWHEVEGSKIRLATDSVRMAIDLLVIRLNYWTGRWTVPSRTPSPLSQSLKK
jgi:dolichyl-phosphate beta-glucosyltransferase